MPRAQKVSVFSRMAVAWSCSDIQQLILKCLFLNTQIITPPNYGIKQKGMYDLIACLVAI